MSTPVASMSTATTDRRVKTLAKNMRKRMTRQEYRLYSRFLSCLPITVCRQKVIGNYIVDFLIPSAMLVIEVDGSQHYTTRGMEKDAARDAWLRGEGYSILRYSNADVMQNLDGVAEDILTHLSAEPDKDYKDAPDTDRDSSQEKLAIDSYLSYNEEKCQSKGDDYLGSRCS